MFFLVSTSFTRVYNKHFSNKVVNFAHIIRENIFVIGNFEKTNKELEKHFIVRETI